MSAADATKDAQLDVHRRRFVATLIEGKTVYDADLAVARPQQHDVVVALRARSAEAAGEELDDLCSRLAPNGMLLLAATGDTHALAERLNARFKRVHRFLQRSVNGSILMSDRFASAQITPLADAAAASLPACECFICGEDGRTLPIGGLFEEGRFPQPAAPPPNLPMARPTLEEPIGSRTDAVALVHRLMSREAAITDLAMQLRAVRASPQAAGGGPGEAGDAAARVVHPWPLRDRPAATRATLDLFDHRPDDDVLDCASAGEAFMHAWSLRSEAPDFAAAVLALNGAPRRLRLSGTEDAIAPVASIVIPVYGQLAYTMNCLDALFGHSSAHSAEIIVVDDQSPDASREHLSRIDGIRFLARPQNGGFIASCNEGADVARGRFIVLLNNDTRVMPGWLDALVDSFTTFPRAGLVGSKFLYPDGSLQECGGIVWRDASAWNYGRDDDPNRPEYNHARQVDYVSGASVAVAAAVWRAVGGFDDFFAPAYYEDVDLCFRLRAAGYETWVQPMSRAIHYEGRTSGTDVRAGVKAYQTRNRGRFFLRHREALQFCPRPGSSVRFARERQVSRRALVIEPTTPTIKEDAGSGYTVMILQLLHELGYKPYFLPENLLYRPEHTPALHRLGVECAYVPYDTSIDSFLQRHGGLFDLALIFRAPTLERTIDLVRERAPQAPVVYNNIDLHYLRLQRAAEIAGDKAARADADELKLRELAVTARADCVLSPSPFEVDLLARELPGVPALALPLMSDIENTTRGFDTRRDICFLGGYRHDPNVDAVRFFIAEVLPLIHREEPLVRFIVAGANPTDEVLDMASEMVVVTGMIDDLRDLFDDARVFVCPLRFGAGMKGKILTAMSFGVPVVSTSMGIEGIAVEDGRNVLVADRPVDIAAACLRAYRDAALWNRLSRAGIDLLERQYSRASGREILRQAVDLAFERHFVPSLAERND